MTRTEYLLQFQGLTERIRRITEAKNNDYGNTDDAFTNLDLIEHVRSNISAADGIFVRMTDKLARIGNLLERGAVVSESLEDSLLDLANYSLILLIRLRDRSLHDQD